MEDVDPLNLRFVEVVVNDEAAQPPGQRLHPPPDRLLAGVLPPVHLVLPPVLIITVGLDRGG